MELFRIANIVMQALCVLLHLIFIIMLIRRRQPTPIWQWFTVVVAGLWIMVSGRLLESVAYIFIHVNSFYVFAVYYQLVGTSFATSAFLIWNVYLARHEKLSESMIFKTAFMTVAGVISLIICTNDIHHLFYEKLVMGEQVVHGKLFMPCLLIVYGMLFAGWIISIVHIIRHGKDKMKRIIVFSLYPVLPAAAALIRSLTGIDELDYTPIVVAVSVFCMYLIVFRNKYVNLIPQSMENALKQTENAIVVYDKEKNEISYANQAALKFEEIIPDILNENTDSYEKVSGDTVLRVHISDIDPSKCIITLSDITPVSSQRKRLEEEIKETDEAILELEDRRKNIDAYLNALYTIPNLKEKQEMFETAEKNVDNALKTILVNMESASENVPECGQKLTYCSDTARDALYSVRAAVSRLRGNS